MYKPAPAVFRWGKNRNLWRSGPFEMGRWPEEGPTRFPPLSYCTFPYRRAGRVVGVMAMKLSNSDEGLAPETRRLLEAFASQAALAIERAHLARKAEQAQLLQATEKLERSLLNSISHDLRTPLSSIMGALSSLRDEESSADTESRRELIDLAWEEAGRMNRFISNLLDITRLEAGALKIKREPYDVQDLLGSCLASLEPRLKEKKSQDQYPPEPSAHPHGFRPHGSGFGQSAGQRLEIFSSGGYDRSCRANPGKLAGNRSRGSRARNSRRVSDAGFQ